MDEELKDFDFHEVDPKDAEEQLKLDGCVYNYQAVCCPGRNKCYKCGWNPRVARQRSYKIRKELGVECRD